MSTFVYLSDTEERTWGNSRLRCKKSRTAGSDSSSIARAVVDALKQGRFYILTRPRINNAIRARMEAILAGRPPSNPMRDA